MRYFPHLPFLSVAVIVDGGQRGSVVDVSISGGSCCALATVM